MKGKLGTLAWSTSQSDFNPTIPATGRLKCRCTKGGACSRIGIYHATMVLQPCYTPNRQRLFFEWIENGYRRSVVWLEPCGRLPIAERLKGCFFLPRRTALTPQYPYPVTPTQGIFIFNRRSRRLLPYRGFDLEGAGFVL